MAKDTGYKGWVNYATWRLHRDLFQGADLADMGLARLKAPELADWMASFAADLVAASAPVGMARNYAHAFLASVDWRELAQAALDDANAEHAD